MNCTSCSNPDVRISHQHHWRDSLERLRGMQAYRCRKCRLRFYAPAPSAVTLTHNGPRAPRPAILFVNAGSARRLLRRVIVIAIFAAMFGVFWFYLRYITKDRVPADNAIYCPRPTRQAVGMWFLMEDRARPPATGSGAQVGDAGHPS